jgi:chaperonin GroES
MKMRTRGMIGQLFSMSADALRQLERDVETVINVLQPGPLGIVEHKYTNKEIVDAKTSTEKAIESWRQASLKRKMTQKVNSKLNNS